MFAFAKKIRASKNFWLILSGKMKKKNSEGAHFARFAFADPVGCLCVFAKMFSVCLNHKTFSFCSNKTIVP